MDELKCPVCGAELEEDDCYDTEIGDNLLFDLCVGHCPVCEREYQWSKVYSHKFLRYEEVVQV